MEVIGAEDSTTSMIENLEEAFSEAHSDIQALMDRVAKLEEERLHKRSVASHGDIALA
jgi:hypothetical protein